MSSLEPIASPRVGFVAEWASAECHCVETTPLAPPLHTQPRGGAFLAQRRPDITGNQHPKSETWDPVCPMRSLQLRLLKAHKEKPRRSGVLVLGLGMEAESRNVRAASSGASVMARKAGANEQAVFASFALNSDAMSARLARSTLRLASRNP